MAKKAKKKSTKASASSKKVSAASKSTKTSAKTTKKAAKKTPAKKAVAKKTSKKTAKKSATTSSTPKKAAKKAVQQAKKTVKKAAAKTSKATKSAARKAASSAELVGAQEEDKPEKKVKSPYKARELKKFQKLLLELRDRLIDEVHFLSGDNLNRSQRDSSGDLSSYSFHMADQGTDNWDREFALSMVSNEQDVLYEIAEALRRIEEKTYGVCEITGDPIEEERLKAIPHTRYSLKAQAEIEKSRGHGRRHYHQYGPNATS